MPTPSIPTAELYQTIARKVKEGSCVLFLGPAALAANDGNGKWKPLTELCAQHLVSKYKLDLGPEEEVNLSYVCSLLRIQNRSTDNVLQEEVAKFYADKSRDCELHPMLEQLTDLKFRMVINTTPDNFVTKLYDQIAQAYYPDFYNWYKPSASFQFDFERDSRIVIYNLLGSYVKPESLVLTYKQQLNYIKKIVGEQQNERIPDALTNAFKDFRHHLFLGFDFDDWVLRLLLDTLYKNVRENVQPYSFNPKDERPAPPDTRVFFQGEFGMQFPPDSLENFVENLVSEYQKLDSPGAALNGVPQVPKAKVLVLYNEAADKDGYDALLKHLRSLPAQFVSVADSVGSDQAGWLRQMLGECKVVMPLLSADFYDDRHNPAVPMLAEIAQLNNPRKGFLVMPVLLKPVGLDGPIAQLATLRPTDREPIIGSGKESQYAAEVAEGLRKYIENLK
jgi:hypothetical protein